MPGDKEDEEGDGRGDEEGDGRKDEREESHAENKKKVTNGLTLDRSFLFYFLSRKQVFKQVIFLFCYLDI